jgi:hypothetical protein
MDELDALIEKWETKKQLVKFSIENRGTIVYSSEYLLVIMELFINNLTALKELGVIKGEAK